MPDDDLLSHGTHHHWRKAVSSSLDGTVGTLVIVVRQTVCYLTNAKQQIGVGLTRISTFGEIVSDPR